METALLVLVVLLVGTGVVLTARAPTRRERAAGAAATLLPVLLFGGPLALWPCGENDCGALEPIFYGLLAADVVALLALLYGPGARRRPS